MEKIKKAKSTKISKEKERAIEKLFSDNVVFKKNVSAKNSKRVVTKNQEKTVRMAKKEESGKRQLPQKKRVKGEEKVSIADGIKRTPRIVVAALVVLLLVAGSGYAYFYRLNKKVSSNQNSSSRTLQEIENRINTFMDLPTDEVPVLATVTDIEKIKDQKFFSKAQNGDSVLIYAKNKKAILYRWPTNKLIEVSNVTGTDEATKPVATAVVASQATTQLQDVQIQNQPDSAVAAPAPDSQASAENQAANEIKARVTVFNGSKTNGLAKKLADSITMAIPNVEIGATANAKGNYSKTLVIDFSGVHSELATQIAQAVGGEIGQLPAGETKPEADILVIGGAK
ncbi:MAG: LytR C-terminal domain-containing protein [Candidatus Moraniibacteriota bacterium]